MFSFLNRNDEIDSREGAGNIGDSDTKPTIGRATRHIELKGETGESLQLTAVEKSINWVSRSEAMGTAAELASGIYGWVPRFRFRIVLTARGWTGIH
jgi:hypothetical protein